LTEFANNLYSLRSEIQRIGRENGSPDEIEKYNQLISAGTGMAEINQTKRDEYERLYRIVYHYKDKLL